MIYERITSDPEFDNSRQSHEYLYQIIGKLTEPTDKIVDMACGTGYGRMFKEFKLVYKEIQNNLYGVWIWSVS